MSEQPGRWLGPHSVLVIRREGGLAFFPGLEAPRRIECMRCSEAQRRRLDALLARLQPLAGKASDGADRRHFTLWVEEDDNEQSSTCDSGQTWSLTLAEEKAPKELVALWKEGRLSEGS
jgi:hypothetical protein